MMNQYHHLESGITQFITVIPPKYLYLKVLYIKTYMFRSEWCDFLDFEIEHSGWQAIWKMPRILCEEFKVIYPNMVLVTVKNICFKLLVATVTVTGVRLFL